MYIKMPGWITEAELIELLRVEGVYLGDDPLTFIALLIQEDGIHRLPWLDGVVLYSKYPILSWIKNGAA